MYERAAHCNAAQQYRMQAHKLVTDAVQAIVLFQTYRMPLLLLREQQAAAAQQKKYRSSMRVARRHREPVARQDFRQVLS